MVSFNRCHMEIIFPPSKSNIEYLWKGLREKSFPHLAIWSWWLPQHCWRRTALLSVPTVGTTGWKSVRVRQRGCRPSIRTDGVAFSKTTPKTCCMTACVTGICLQSVVVTGVILGPSYRGLHRGSWMVLFNHFSWYLSHGNIVKNVTTGDKKAWRLGPHLRWDSSALQRTHVGRPFDL